VIREVEDIPDTGVDDLGLPDVQLLFPRHVVALDHLRQVLTVVTNVVVSDTSDPRSSAARYDAAVTACDAVIERLATARTPLPPVAPPQRGAMDPAPSNLAPGEYQAMVERVKEHIRAGDTFQTVISQRFALDTEVTAFELYRVLRVINPSPYLYLLDTGDAQIVGSSPEALVQVQDRRVETWPIAGTRPRGATPRRTGATSRSWWPTPRSAPSTSCSSTSRATTSAGSVTSAACRSTGCCTSSATAT
jgi:anthranilate synthase component I